jgi:hypothetical protein
MRWARSSAAADRLAAALGERAELGVAVRNRAARESGLEQALGHQIRKPPIRGGGMRVVGDGETEVPVPGRAWSFQRVLAAAHELHDREREIGERRGIRAPPLCEEVRERGGVRLRG